MTNPIETQSAQVIVHRMTQEQYNNLSNPSETEFYLLTDANPISSNDVYNALGYTPLRNTATGTNSLTILGTATTATSAVNIGATSTAGGGYSVALGYYAASNGARSTSIGYGARIGASTADAIQIGNGTNSTAKSLSVGFYNTANYILLDGTTGFIPPERINAVKNQNSSSDTSSIKTWTGTLAQYDAITTKDSGTMYYVIDD
jgi:hypothetical protein